MKREDIVTERRGNSITDRIHFRVVSGRALTNDEVFSAQVTAGYHPCGYGTFGIIHRDMGDGQVATEWNCSASCD